jgi:hypothetical protein
MKLAAADGHASKEAIREALGVEVVRGILEAPASVWLPVEWDVVTARVLHDVLGPEEHRVLATKVMADAFGGPLLGPLVRSAIAIMDLRPGRWARWIARGWGAVFDDVGEWAIETEGQGAVQLRLHRLPAACVEDDIWARSVANHLSALQACVKVAGRTEFSALEPAARTARYVVRWVVPPSSM